MGALQHASKPENPPILDHTRRNRDTKPAWGREIFQSVNRANSIVNDVGLPACEIEHRRLQCVKERLHQNAAFEKRPD